MSKENLKAVCSAAVSAKLAGEIGLASTEVALAALAEAVFTRALAGQFVREHHEQWLEAFSRLEMARVLSAAGANPVRANKDSN